MNFTFYDRKGQELRTIEHVTDIDLSSLGWLALSTEGDPFIVQFDPIVELWVQLYPDTEESTGKTYNSGWGVAP